MASVTAQGWTQLGELGLAFVLGSLIGLEREYRQKSAGLRTHTLVALGSALFLMVSKYGFADVLGNDVVLDPSRVAAQVVSGLGFIGGGLIFVRGDAVRGLTTAAIVWVAAAVGMACAAGLVLLALATTTAHFIVVLVYPQLARALPRSRYVGFGVRVVYADGRGILREVLSECSRRGFSISRLNTQELEHAVNGMPAASVSVEVRGQPDVQELTQSVTAIPGVLEVTTVDLGQVVE